VTAAEYLQRKVDGVCVYSVGCHEACDEESVWCAAHHLVIRQAVTIRLASGTYRARKNRYSRRWRRRRHARGLCTMCPNARDPSSFFCLTCEERLRRHPRRNPNNRRGATHATTAAAPVPAAGRVPQAAARAG
jgi:hypothetical protein